LTRWPTVPVQRKKGKTFTGITLISADFSLNTEQGDFNRGIRGTHGTGEAELNQFFLRIPRIPRFNSIQTPSQTARAFPGAAPNTSDNSATGQRRA
jgi:hypothetical protein